MAAHIEEDEQLEAFKRWWQENGLPIALAIVLGLGGWFGWQYWRDSRQEKAVAGSLLYQKMLEPLAGASIEELSEEQLAEVAESATQLKADHKGQQYGALAGLSLAKLAVSRDDLEAASTELKWVMANSSDDALVDIARLRLVRVLSAAERYEEALELAEGSASESIATGLAEARGDIYFLRGDMRAARAAYQLALDGLQAEDAMLRPLLEIKLNQVLPGDVDLSEDLTRVEITGSEVVNTEEGLVEELALEEAGVEKVRAEKEESK